MTSPTRIECVIRTKTKGCSVGRRPGPLPGGRVPRIARLLALAHKFDNLLRQNVIANYAALAQLGHVSRARITQIMNLLHLAPDIQEDILFLPPTVQGRDAIHLRQLQALTLVLDWSEQRARWQKLRRAASRQERTWGEGETVATTGKDYDGQV
jgi:hypothetical protein